MSILITAFNTILYRPLLNALILLYQYIPGHDFGLAVIVLTILIKFLFYPLGVKAIKSQKALSTLQPKIKEIQEKYKDNKEQQTREIMGLYKREKINPFSGCLPLLIQLPVLIALYQVFWKGLQPDQFSSLLYNFVPHVGSIDASFLGIIDLSHSATVMIENVRHYLWPNIALILLVAIVQFIQMKMSTPNPKKSEKQDSSFAGQMQKQMLYFMPVFMVFILFRMPSAIALYWLTTTLFTIIQQYVILKKEK